MNAACSAYAGPRRSETVSIKKDGPGPATAPLSKQVNAKPVGAPSVSSTDLVEIPSRVEKSKQATPGSMSFHRGEHTGSMPGPEIRLIGGLTIYRPLAGVNPRNFQLAGGNVAKLFESLQKKIREEANGDVEAFAQYLRAEWRNFGMATARTGTGAYDVGRHYYVATIPGIRTFHWGEGLTVGAAANFSTPESITNDYIVLNGDTPETSTILAFGHKTGTHEVTFLTDIPPKWIAQYNKKPASEVTVLTSKTISIDDKIKYQEMMRGRLA